MTAFVTAVEALQTEHGVAICSAEPSDSVALRDLRRTEQWMDAGCVYGWHDALISGTADSPHSGPCSELKFYEACICGALEPGVQVQNIAFEDFGAWGE